jgi:hypothetical protein
MPSNPHNEPRRAWSRRTVCAALFALNLACQQLAFKAPSQARSLKSINYTCGVTQVSIEVLIGEGADGGGGGLRLFDGDSHRAEAFELTLISQIAATLQDQDVEIVKEAPNTILVAIYGHPVDSVLCESSDVYTAEVFLDTESLPLGNTGSAPALGSRIGVSPRSKLEAELAGSVLGILKNAWCQQGDEGR